jgi:arylsulfatase A-like enzyme
MPGEAVWAGTTVFPKLFELPRRAQQMTTSPWGDAFILDAGRAAIKAEKLGTRGGVDLLALGLSCTDYVGHSYGPNSHEMQDHLARLDVALGSFLAEVETIVGKGNVIVGLSADHACLPLPEYTANVEHKFSRRLNVATEVWPKAEALRQTLMTEWGIEETLFTRTGFIDYNAAAKKGITPAQLEARLREGFVAIDGIADVFFKREIAAGTVPPRPFARRFVNSMYLPRSEDFQIRFCEGCLPTSRPTGTSHGSCYDYDNAVPVVVWGQPFTVNRVGRPVRTIDVVPTLARKLGVPYPATVLGTPLKEVLEDIR